MVFLGLRELPGHSTISAKSRKFPLNQDELVILSKEERPVAPDREIEASLDPNASISARSLAGFLAPSPMDYPITSQCLFV